MKRPTEKHKKGFTLIELVMVVLLLAVLAAVAIPNFIDFRTEAKNAAINGALGAMRSAISIAGAAIALKEDVSISAPRYPTILEMQANAYNASHPVLSSGSTVNRKILDDAAGIPTNPWSLSTVPRVQINTIWDCGSMTKSFVRSVTDENNFGWCYNGATGQIWANSRLNQAADTNNLENHF